MKATARIARKSGGKSEESPASGDKTYEKDEKDKPARYNSSKVEDEAEERKAGGKVAKKTGGVAAKARKAGGKTELKCGGAAAPHAGRSARKSGGSCDSSPMSSAHAGTPAKGRSGAKEVG